mmetsp:Transcript_27289/g.59719  ORF Transcript_27289/g.59719 Transcript_27289/m.59719 type:complete len:214 (-) Transcript_27289:76-717(-)
MRSYGRSSDKGMVPSWPTSTPSMLRSTSSTRRRLISEPASVSLPSIGTPVSRRGVGAQTPDTLTPPPSPLSLRPSLLRSALLSRVCVLAPSPAMPGTIRGPTMPTTDFFSFLALSSSTSSETSCICLSSLSPCSECSLGEAASIFSAFNADLSNGLASNPSSVIPMKCDNTSVGIIYPILLEPLIPLLAIPITRPNSSNTGPPLLPGLMAASI